ncbi:MAG TPA: TIGR03936 family radical SAM-associated protein [Brevefilum fermentans]|jgi:radical SAM-linked protein|nr:TIGR03936 family radical SAM-associated protein [Brevefilum fermentans]HQA28204.1 TIGR03936 family radical SAM-associated protein [Brevefilum fermentans]
MPVNAHPLGISRIRVVYVKRDGLRFTGHLDLQRLWERLLRRSKLPLRYTQGYHPRARLNLASALPLGFISDEELLDFWMDESLPLPEIQQRLTAVAPPGLEIYSVQQVDMGEDALQVQMKASEFEVSFYDPQNILELNHQVEQLLNQTSIPITRRKKTYNLRPLILALETATDPDGAVILRMRLKAEPGATGRPDDLLETLGYPNTAYLVRRTRLLLN